MGSVSAAEGELGRQVRFKHIHFSDVGLKLGVYGGLGGLARGGCICAGSLCGIGLVGLAGKKAIIDLRHVDAGDGDRGGGGDHVLLVDTTQGHTVASVGA
jgi:hypothetical protein